MTQIEPFDPWRSDVLSMMNHIILAHPVSNLTQDEVLTTLRLIELKKFLNEGRYDQVCIHKNDKRLELCDDNDKFLAMLADCDARGVLLFSGRCRSLFGGTVYHWRNIGRKCPITAVASAISECGSGYYGRGWEIAPHIVRLREWIIDNILNNNNHGTDSKTKEE